MLSMIASASTPGSAFQGYVFRHHEGGLARGVGRRPFFLKVSRCESESPDIIFGNGNKAFAYKTKQPFYWVAHIVARMVGLGPFKDFKDGFEH